MVSKKISIVSIFDKRQIALVDSNVKITHLFTQAKFLQVLLLSEKGVPSIDEEGFEIRILSKNLKDCR